MALNKRRVFETLRKEYGGLEKGNVRLSESSLVLIQPITTGKTNYNFPVLQTEPSPIGITQEIRLNMNDVFTATSVGVFIGGFQRNAADTAGTGSFKWWSYAPTELFGNTVSLDPLYEGVLNFSQNKINYLTNWRLSKHRFVQQTEFANFQVAAAGPPVISNSYPATMPNINNNKDGMVDLNATISLIGSTKNEVDIVLPQGLTARIPTYVDQQGGTNYVHLDYIITVFDGFLGQNAAAFQK